MAKREIRLREGRREGVPVKGAPYKPVPASRKGDGQPRPVRHVKTTAKPRLLREPSRPADLGKAGDPDPHGNRDPVVFHEYGPADPERKNLTHAADMSGADTEADVVMMSVVQREGGDLAERDPQLDGT